MQRLISLCALLFAHDLLNQSFLAKYRTSTMVVYTGNALVFMRVCTK